MKKKMMSNRGGVIGKDGYAYTNADMAMNIDDAKGKHPFKNLHTSKFITIDQLDKIPHKSEKWQDPDFKIPNRSKNKDTLMLQRLKIHDTWDKVCKFQEIEMNMERVFQKAKK